MGSDGPIYKKFRVYRTDRRDGPGDKHHDCWYFVLDLDHDPYAVPALQAYALACKGEYPELASSIAKALEELGGEDGK